MAVNKKECRFSWVRIHLGADSGKESLHNAAVSGVSQVTPAALKQDNAGLRSHASPSGVHSQGYADLFLVLNRRVDLMNPLVIPVCNLLAFHSEKLSNRIVRKLAPPSRRPSLPLSPWHSTEHGFDHIEELCPRGQWGGFYNRISFD